MKRKKLNLKKINILFLFLGLLVFAPKSVSAKLEVNVSNGGSNREPAKGPGTTSACNSVYASGNQLCRFQLVSGEPRGVRISLMYCDGTKCSQVGKTMDMWSKEPYGTKGLQSAGQSKVNSDALYYSDFQGGNYEYIVDSGLSGKKGNELADYLTSQFLDQKVQEEMAKTLAGEDLEAMKKYMTNGHQEADPTGKNPANVGYRFMAEDVRGYLGADGTYYVMTPTEYERLRKGGAKLQPLRSEEVSLWTKFDDVGIATGAGKCYGYSGGVVDPSSFLDPKNGCGQYIIDFKEEVLEEILKITLDPNTECDWEALKQKSFGDTLTAEEQACCDELKLDIFEDINIDFKNACFISNTTIEGAIACFQEYFLNWSIIDSQTKDQQEMLKKLYEDYPVCGCDFEEAETIQATFDDCFKSDIFNEMQSLIKTGKNGAPHSKCYDKYTSSVTEYFAYNSPEICGPLLDDCPIEECPWLDPDPKKCEIVDGKYYGLNGTEVDKATYDKECGKNHNPEDPCDENDPNSFPVPGTDHENDRYCCDEVFEPGLKLQYSLEAQEKGLIGDELDNYVAEQLDAWFHAADFRIYCLTGCDYDAEVAAGGKFTKSCCEQFMAEHPEIPADDPYWISKGCASPSKNECNWVTYTTPLVDELFQMHEKECEAGYTNVVKVSDTFEKDCIFESEELDPTTPEGKVFRDYFLKFSNPYCAVYCREDVEYRFPQGEMEVKAGHHFTVGSDSGHIPEWEPIHFTSTRECETFGPTSMDKEDDEAKKIQTEKFEEDWQYQNMRVIYAYDSLMAAKNELYSAMNAKVEDVCPAKCLQEIPIYSDEGEVVGTDCIKWSQPGQKWKGAIAYHTHWNSASETNPSAGDRREHTVEFCAYEDIKGETRADWIKSYSQEVKTQQDLFECEKNTLTNIEDDIHACTDFNVLKGYSIPQEDTEGKEPDCEAFVSKTNLKAKRYSPYSSHDDFADYREFEPTVSINYVEPTYPNYNYSGELEKEIQQSNSGNFSTDGKEFSIKYECSGPGVPDSMHCYKKKVFKYSPQEKTEATYVKDIEYRMNKNVFNTILKPEGIAVHGNSFQAFRGQIQLKLDYGALHVHFMTPSGIYGKTADDNGALDLTFPQFTANDPSLDRIHNFDREEFGSTGIFLYDCNYKVVNEIIENGDDDCIGDNCEECEGGNCDPNTLKGLNLIFRPISLANPFSGALGDGRNSGSNWSGEGDIENYITNNRGVNDNKLYYDKAPMYQITLTPALIQQVRRYNETTSYNDFNMDCLSNGRECKSQFLRGSVGEYDFSKQLENCEYSGNKGSEPCCGIGNWNDCNEKDGITRKE